MAVSNEDLSVLSDVELVEKCREENSAVYFSELISRYFPLIRKRVSAVCRIESSYDDFVQEGLIGLLNASRSFDPSKGVSFSTYAFRCISNRLINVAEGINRSDSTADEYDDVPAPGSSFFSSELYIEMKNILSELEYSALSMYISGLSPTEIAEVLSTDRRSVQNAVARARKKMRNSFSH